ncbi:MAG TPA: hypothetical protein VMI93_10935 [Candidatus Solibacter sp.]|nr:hypothetical protein [Candidatus Solibacter sp.]
MSRELSPLLHRVPVRWVAISGLGMAMWLAPATPAQNPQLQEHVAEIKQSMAQNRQALAQYTWQEQETISIKGETKKQKQFQVRLGTDGKPQKEQIGAPDQTSDGGRQHGVKHRIKEEKKEEFEDYGKQIAGLAEDYMQQEPGKLQLLYEQGNITVGSAGAPGEIRIVVRSYVKQGDSVTIIYGQQQRAVQSIQISSYLSDPSDVVNISAQFVQLPNGPNHVYDLLVNGVSKRLTVEMQNSNYQHL